MQYIKTLLTSLLCIALSTAYCQRDTVVIDTWKFEDAIIQIAQGQSAQRMLDSMKKWYREDLKEANDNIRMLQRADSAAKVYEAKLLTQISGLQLNRDLFYAKYQKEAAAKHKPFGLALMPIGYNPFTKSVTAGVGFVWTPRWLRFSTKGVRFTDTGDIEIPRSNEEQRLIQNQILR